LSISITPLTSETLVPGLIVKINTGPLQTVSEEVTDALLEIHIDLGLFTSHAINLRVLRYGEQHVVVNVIESAIAELITSPEPILLHKRYEILEG
jgi:hypothetical protein